jgi:hypothetical protein
MMRKSSEERPNEKIYDPFSQQDLNAVFQVSPSDTKRLISRESGWLEFKQSFGFGNIPKYARTLAAFSNANGGYIVFGVQNQPHIMVGLKKDTFENIDPEKLSTFLNDHFAPELKWEARVHELNGMQFGLLFVFECKQKPVICIRTSGEGQVICEGEIYYRYRGQTSKIKYPELRSIINESREKEQRLWLRHLTRIARIGVRSAGIFDLNSGVVSGAGGTFLIDESLLDQLQFIREGEFNEKKGAPVIKIVGKAEPVGAGLIASRREVIKTRAIRTPDIVKAFLENKKVPDAFEYVSQICFETSAYLPVYHYLCQLSIDKKTIMEKLGAVQSTSQAKKKLIERLSSDEDLSVAIPSSDHPNAVKKLNYWKALKRKKVKSDVDISELKLLLQAICILRRKDLHPEYLRKLLKTWFDKFYGKDNPEIVPYLRKAICHLDILINKEH